MSSVNKQEMGWGVLLITFGAAALLNLITTVSDWTYVGIYALGGLVALAIFLTHRKDWVVLIPAYILFAVALVTTITTLDLVRGSIIAPAVLMLIALPFVVVFLFNPKLNWWALIPSWVLLAISGMILLIDLGLLADGLVPLYVLSAVGLPFLLVFFLNRQNWWALIPAWVMLVIGVMVFLIDARFLTDLAIPAYIMFAIAIPFVVVYLFKPGQNRWALIPAGITGLIGLGFFAGTDLSAYVIPAVLIVVGGWVLVGSLRKREG